MYVIYTYTTIYTHKITYSSNIKQIDHSTEFQPSPASDPGWPSRHVVLLQGDPGRHPVTGDAVHHGQAPQSDQLVLFLLRYESTILMNHD